MRGTVRLRAAAIGRSDRRKRGRGDQRAVRRFGTHGCVSRMAQEFGDHSQAAAERMRWVRQLAAEAAAPATCEPGPEAARVAGSPATTGDQRNQHERNETQ